MYKLSQGADPPPGWKDGDVGMQYAYMDHSTTGAKPPLAEGMTIDNADTALGRTLTQIYSTAEASDTGMYTVVSQACMRCYPGTRWF